MTDIVEIQMSWLASEERARKAEAEVTLLRVLALAVETRCRRADPEWAPELREALAAWRAVYP